MPGALQDTIDAEEAELEAWSAEARRIGAKKIAVRFVTGIAWDEIGAITRSDPAIDLVVMGTHGRTGLRHVVLGSVAEKVVRHAACPVLVVRARAET